MQHGQDTNRLQVHFYIVNSSIAQISQKFKKWKKLA